MQRVGQHGEIVLIVDQHHVMIEIGILGARRIFTVERREGVHLIVDGAPFLIPSQAPWQGYSQGCR